MSSMYIAHYGIKGQKHGVRNYQNEDGSLTPAGMERYGHKKQYNDSKISRNVLGGDLGMRAFANWREKRHKQNLSKAEAEGNDKKIEKYKKKLEAQSAANANMRAYREHSSGKKLAAQNFLGAIAGGRRYRHARARGAGRIRSLLEMGPTLGTALRMVGDKKAYGKAIVWSADGRASYYGYCYGPSEEELNHFGIKGQRWGVRNFQNEDGTLTSAGKERYGRTGIYDKPDGTKDMKRLKKDAQKDAEEYARAKAYYGDGAGTRRKKIKNKISEKMKDEDYKKAFEEHLSRQDMSEHQKKATRERHINDAKAKTAKVGRGIKNFLLGAGTTSLAAIAIVNVARATGADKQIAQWGKTMLSQLGGSFGKQKSSFIKYDSNGRPFI